MAKKSAQMDDAVVEPPTVRSAQEVSSVDASATLLSASLGNHDSEPSSVAALPRVWAVRGGVGGHLGFS